MPIRVRLVLALVVAAAALPARAQSFLAQCPATTTLHPNGSVVDPSHPGVVKCQQVSGGDGYATMADGHQIYLFAFSPLSGLADIQAGLPGTQTADVFNGASGNPAFSGPNYSQLSSGAANWAATPNNAGIVDPAGIMDFGVLAGSAPAPLIAIDEDDELYLTLSNVGMIMRPDLFEQHTIHFHGYPNASSYYDGVPDASIAIDIAGSFTYYYTAPDAGTYFWHCHITPPEHLQMGMVGQLFVRPRQNRVPVGQSLYAALLAANKKAAVDPNATGLSCSDFLCTGQTPAPTSTVAVQTAYSYTGTTPPASNGSPVKYAYNDGDGSTAYDVDVPLQLMGFDPNFHYVGMTFNPEQFADMKDKYFLLNGRGYPDTVKPGAMTTVAADGVARPSQPLPAVITINKTAGQTRALLRISDLSVTEFSTLGVVGVPMTVIALNARLLRDLAGNNLYYQTNSITLGGGESADAILDVSNVPQGTYYLYSTNLDHLSNDAENFGGMMTEIHVQ